MNQVNPVVVVVFNRPEVTQRLIQALAAVKPARLYVAADGPRHEDDVPKCDAVRGLFDDLPWDCDVRRDFSTANLGCGRRLPTALDWVFQQEERAIVLEDDCIPHPSFFRYCDELLDRYAEDETVGCISGDCVPGVGTDANASYRFSWLPLIWGWATWRRAWVRYDHYLSDWPASNSRGWLNRRMADRLARRALSSMFDEAKAKGDAFSVWDYQWTYACLRHGMRSVLPADTMISNIGFGPDATHTRGGNGPRARLRPTPMKFPLRHPDGEVDRGLDAAMFHAMHPYVRRNHRTLVQRVRSFVTDQLKRRLLSAQPAVF